jgi:hypothetical protein
MWFAGIKAAAARFWRSYIAAEDPDAGLEQVRQQRIDQFTLFADLLEAMRGWDRERSQLGEIRRS